MGSGQFVDCNSKGKVCLDCGKAIEIGERYWYMRTPKKNYLYCIDCKKHHVRKTYDYEKIYNDILSKPLFKHEFEKRFGSNSCKSSNDLIRNIIARGYPVRIFRWSMCAYNYSRKREKDAYRSHYQPNHFIIYFVEGTENKVVGRLLDTFGFDQIRWRDLLCSLFGQKIPTAMHNRDVLMQWANQNVYNLVQVKANGSGLNE